MQPSVFHCAALVLSALLPILRLAFTQEGLYLFGGGLEKCPKIFRIDVVAENGKGDTASVLESHDGLLFFTARQDSSYL